MSKHNYKKSGKALGLDLRYGDKSPHARARADNERMPIRN